MHITGYLSVQLFPVFLLRAGCQSSISTSITKPVLVSLVLCSVLSHIRIQKCLEENDMER